MQIKIEIFETEAGFVVIAIAIDIVVRPRCPRIVLVNSLVVLCVLSWELRIHGMCRVVWAWDFRLEVDVECARAFPLEGELPIPGSATGWRKYEYIKGCKHQQKHTGHIEAGLLILHCIYRMRENPRFALHLAHYK